MKKGMILSIISAICFGLVPLFTKIVLSMNYDVIAIGFFRFLGLGIFSACMIKIKKVPLKLDVSILPSIALDSFFQVLTLILLSTSYSVSYTHLDVYKRQTLGIDRMSDSVNQTGIVKKIMV